MQAAPIKLYRQAPQSLNSKMKIFITKKHYGALVDLLYVADWVLHAHDVDERPETRHYRELIQMLLGQAKDMQAKELVESFEDHLMPSRVVEDRMQPILDAYDEASLWEDLIALLGERDAVRAIGAEALQKLPREDRVEILFKHEVPWGGEFEEYGLSRLVVDEAHGAKD